jgi:hypothetical protein
VTGCSGIVSIDAGAGAGRRFDVHPAGYQVHAFTQPASPNIGQSAIARCNNAADLDATQEQVGVS